MIKKQDCMDFILQNVPDFERAWRAHLEYWDGEEAGLCNDMSAFSSYVEDLVAKNRTENLKPIFDLIEQLMNDGDQTVKDAVATCFLENLINRASAGSVPARAFVHLLGPRSRAYCKAWDDFTGVRTEGL